MDLKVSYFLFFFWKVPLVLLELINKLNDKTFRATTEVLLLENHVEKFYSDI